MLLMTVPLIALLPVTGEVISCDRLIVCLIRLQLLPVTQWVYVAVVAVALLAMLCDRVRMVDYCVHYVA